LEKLLQEIFAQEMLQLISKLIYSPET